MTPRRQVGIISTIAVLSFIGLRSLPDTQCAFLHADHQPVIAQGVEFCGVNEEANFYSPQALKFPFKLELSFSEDRQGGTLRLIGEENRPLLVHEIAVSHTQKVHLHLRQVTGRNGYIHLHPQPRADGSWEFRLPPEFTDGNPGGEFHAYVDFVTMRANSVILAETTARIEVRPTPVQALKPRNSLQAVTISTQRTDTSALIRVTIASPAGQPPLKLQPLMGSLGHAVLFSSDGTKPTGYAHLHPSLEGGEFEPNPTLSFRLRLPPPGRYDFWVHVNDGSEDYLLVPIEVTP